MVAVFSSKEYSSFFKIMKDKNKLVTATENIPAKYWNTIIWEDYPKGKNYYLFITIF